MQLKTLTYTSRASLDLDASGLLDIRETARRLNPLDGITGLLVFNGSRFLQIVEGGEEAIDHLVERLRGDRRHSAIEIRDERIVAERAFPDWSMELVTVSARHLEARGEIEEVLPAAMAPPIRAMVLAMAERIAVPLELD